MCMPPPLVPPLVWALVLKSAKKAPSKNINKLCYQSGGIEIFRCLFYVNLREIDNRNLYIIMVIYKFLIDCLPACPVCRYVQTPEVVMD